MPRRRFRGFAIRPTGGWVAILALLIVAVGAVAVSMRLGILVVRAYMKQRRISWWYSGTCAIQVRELLNYMLIWQKAITKMQ